MVAATAPDQGRRNGHVDQQGTDSVVDVARSMGTRHKAMSQLDRNEMVGFLTNLVSLLA